MIGVHPVDRTLETSTALIQPTSQTQPSRGLRGRSRLFFFAAILVFLGLIATFGGRWLYLRVEFGSRLNDAQSAANDGRVLDAIRHLQFCQSIDADHRRVMILVARVARQSHTYDRAEELLDRYWQIHGDDEDSTFERLLLKAASEDTDSLVGILRMRMAAGGEVADQCRFAIVSGYLRDYRYAEAQGLIDEWSRSTAGPLPALLRGKMQEQLLQFQPAAETYASIVDGMPSHLDARIRLVRMLMEQRNAEGALLHLTYLAERIPTHPEVLLQRALALRQIGRTDDAVRALDEALEHSPHSATALTERAALALNAGDDEAAVDWLKRAVKADPGAVGARNLLAQAYARLGRNEEVDRENEQVKKLTADSDRLTALIHGPLHSRPNDPVPPYEISGIALRSGQVSEAIRWLHLALKRDASHAPSHTALAVIYHEMGNPVLATKHRALATGGKR